MLGQLIQFITIFKKQNFKLAVVTMITVNLLIAIV